MSGLFDPTGQGLLQLSELLLAFILSGLVGLEREVRQKSAGLRTHTLVGVSAALFMLISKYGFMDVLVTGRVVVDPSRVAAQIVSGIGFIGGGVIFMRRDVVRGLTTAASVWLTAALGMACGAGLLVLALATAACHFLIMFLLPKLAAHLPRERRTATRVRIAYLDSDGLLRSILIACTQLRFSIDQVEVETDLVAAPRREHLQDAADLEGVEPSPPARSSGPTMVLLSMQVKGKRPISNLIARLSEIRGVTRVGSISDEADLE